MRVNVYSQELTNDFVVVSKEGENGEVYSAIMIFLHSSSHLHQPPEHTGSDDDRSAVTFWLPKSSERRARLADMFESIANAIRKCSPETA